MAQRRGTRPSRGRSLIAPPGRRPDAPAADRVVLDGSDDPRCLHRRGLRPRPVRPLRAARDPRERRHPGAGRVPRRRPHARRRTAGPCRVADGARHRLHGARDPVHALARDARRPPARRARPAVDPVRCATAGLRPPGRRCGSSCSSAGRAHAASCRARAARSSSRWWRSGRCSTSNCRVGWGSSSPCRATRRRAPPLGGTGYVARISSGRAASPWAWCSLRATCGPTVTERWVTRNRRG